MEKGGEVVVIVTPAGVLVGETLAPEVIALHPEKPIQITYPHRIVPQPNGTAAIQPVPVPKDTPVAVVKEWILVHRADEHLKGEFEKAKAQFNGIKIAKRILKKVETK